MCGESALYIDTDLHLTNTLNSAVSGPTELLMVTVYVPLSLGTKLLMLNEPSLFWIILLPSITRAGSVSLLHVIVPSGLPRLATNERTISSPCVSVMSVVAALVILGRAAQE